MSGADRGVQRGLDGLRVLVPRAGEPGERIAQLVRSHGGNPELVPLIEHAPPADPRELLDAVARWNAGEYDWLAVTSAQGALAFSAAGARSGHGKVAAVGPATARALAAVGFSVDLQPDDEFTGRSLADALVAELQAHPVSSGARLLLPLSEIAEPTLEESLREAGHDPHRITAYRTLEVPADPERDAQLAASLGAVLVMSSSNARALSHRFSDLNSNTIIAAIGEPTARELARLGMTAHVVATEQTSEGIVRALAEYVTDPSTHSEGVTA
ncbi:uroporphyrinogen-III synthase [Leucobacter denitrificans]|uniref:Uroporphyrinogen-III synthase n=1 Tax=Leucobacter denitrificans TaxID=683042 RepID=A0A7G9S734_9MICO|nr:uroporphyrinogen-III synthase [Leucobacter denitrificans]QNN63659.1 uroporphyrinogen-III synthase [Leucobacter denitrificans]